jgi:anti-sigma B factor antagonist
MPHRAALPAPKAGDRWACAFLRLGEERDRNNDHPPEWVCILKVSAGGCAMNIEKATIMEKVPVLRLSGELDLGSVPDVRKAIRSYIEDGQVNFIIDITGLDFIDSSGLGVLVGGLARVRERQGEIKLVCANRRILRVFEMTRLTQLFEIHETEEEAAQRFLAGGQEAA